MLRCRTLILFSFLFLTNLFIEAQITVDSLMRRETPCSIKEFLSPYHVDLTSEGAMKIEDNNPAFALYKDSYFLTGVPLNKKITNQTADAIFRISIRQRLSKSTLPFKTFLYLTYTQNSFWQIYEESSPFKDNNYNPGIGIGKYLVRDNKLLGGLFIQLQHESNGRDGNESRSWNFISVAGKYFLSPWVAVRAETWLPYVDGGENKDLLDYKGYGILSLNAINPSKRWWLSFDITPRKGFGNENISIGLAYKITKKSYQYAFVQFYSGYSEKLLEYDKYSNYLRFGICLKPDFYSIY